MSDNMMPELTLNPTEAAQEAVPELTLTPEAPTAPEAEKKEVEPVKVDESMLTEQEKKAVDDFAKKIDITDTNLVLNYGVAAQKSVATFSENALSSVRNKDLGEVGETLSNLVVEVKGFGQEEKKGFAGLFRKQKGGVFVGTVVGCVCRFIVHFISGVTIYRIYEPTELFNTTFANPYIYSAAYNGSYMVIDLVLCLVITALLYRPLSRYFAPQETVAAVKRNQGPEL